MMDRVFLIREYRKIKAFKKLFYDNAGKLKPEAEIVLAVLRDYAGAKGNLVQDGSSLLYDANGRFDAAQAAFGLGKRRIFDLIIKYLALNEIEVFNLVQIAESEDVTLQTNLNI